MLAIQLLPLLDCKKSSGKFDAGVPQSIPERANVNFWRRERDSNPRNRFRFSGFQDHRHRPLGHLSARRNLCECSVSARLPRVRPFECPVIIAKHAADGNEDLIQMSRFAVRHTVGSGVADRAAEIHRRRRLGTGLTRRSEHARAWFGPGRKLLRRLRSGNLPFVQAGAAVIRGRDVTATNHMLAPHHAVFLALRTPN
jgi:hypothetical protein